MRHSGDQASEPTTVVVVGSKRTWWVFVAFGLIGSGIALLSASLYLALLTRGGLILTLPFALVGVAFLIGALGLLDRVPRCVYLGSAAVEAQYLLSKVRIPWDRLKSPVPDRTGFVAFFAEPGTRGVVGPVTLTVRQAKAVLSYPKCPTLELSAEVIRALEDQGGG